MLIYIYSRKILRYHHIVSLTLTWGKAMDTVNERPVRFPSNFRLGSKSIAQVGKVAAALMPMGKKTTAAFVSKTITTSEYCR